MSHYLVKKSKLAGEIIVPSSKSHTLRAILFGSLAHGKTTIHSPLVSTDAHAMIEACKLFGAEIQVAENKIEITGLKGKITRCEDVINAGNSGIVLRFCSAIGALSSRPVVITGDHSIRHQRPMQPLLDALSHLGAYAISTKEDGYAPIYIRGPLQPGRVVIEGQDSQPVSALLIASAFSKGQTDIIVENPGEKPWVALTLSWFEKLGIPYTNDKFQVYRVEGHAKYKGFEYSVPGDFSSAAYPIAAALVTNSKLTIKNIDMSDSQGDKELIAIFKKMGAIIDYDERNHTLHVGKTKSLSGVTADINNFIDCITILAVVACFAEGETHIKNCSIARQKECDRIQCITTELRKMGADFTETEDGLIVRQSSLTGACLNSHHDHRMAMSLAVAGLGALGETKISSVACVAKTFPSFVPDFNAFGANIKESYGE